MGRGLAQCPPTPPWPPQSLLALSSCFCGIFSFISCLLWTSPLSTCMDSSISFSPFSLISPKHHSPKSVDAANFPCGCGRNRGAVLCHITEYLLMLTTRTLSLKVFQLFLSPTFLSWGIVFYLGSSFLPCCGSFLIQVPSKLNSPHPQIPVDSLFVSVQAYPIRGGLPSRTQMAHHDVCSTKGPRMNSPTGVSDSGPFPDTPTPPVIG